MIVKALWAKSQFMNLPNERALQRRVQKNGTNQDTEIKEKVTSSRTEIVAGA